MTELKLKCYSCDFERIVGEREFIEDLQQCPNCGSDNIEIVPIEDSKLVREVDRYLPEEREQIVRRRMTVIGVIGALCLVCGYLLFVLSRGYGLFPLTITLVVIGVLLLIIALGWMTDGVCCCACSG
ncbi:MAG: hypothetical protein ACFE75_07795 [Candidatus Hodarchaeota archaeon]